MWLFSQWNYEKIDGGEKSQHLHILISNFPLITRSCVDKAQSILNEAVMMSPAFFWTTSLNIPDNLKPFFPEGEKIPHSPSQYSAVPSCRFVTLLLLFFSFIFLWSSQYCPCTILITKKIIKLIMSFNFINSKLSDEKTIFLMRNFPLNKM